MPATRRPIWKASLRIPAKLGRRIVVVWMVLGSCGNSADRLDFNRDVRPILSDHCFACHGPDSKQRQAGLRLDIATDALRGGESGPALVPGKPDESLVLARVLSPDESEVMPPPSTNKRLTAEQKEKLRRWIVEGAEFQNHWAFVAPQRPALPNVRTQSWPKNEIDHFVLARLESLGLAPSPEAERTTLIRRLSLDLTGLPPTPHQVDDFLNDASPQAYERVVDRLLSSPHFGERMAVDWLDAARFADSNGYQVDRDREMYAWRDWVIRAFNENLPFDQFTLEQLAGDLLPAPTIEQRIATGFHRNHMMNEEGGVIPEEFLAEYTADRVETTAAVWLGQTFNCARCHDHKFDPFTQRDFYSLKAYFHNVTEKGLGDYGQEIRRNNPPMLKLPSAEQEAKLAALKSELSAATGRRAERERELRAAQPEWETKVRAGSEVVEPADLLEIIKKDAGQRAANEAKRLGEFFLQRHDDYRQLGEQITGLSKRIDELDLAIPTTLVMEEMPQPRTTNVLVRGAYDKKGDEVQPATPAILPAIENLPRNRRGLAQWLVDPRNPLPARVTVNRYWQSLFGIGLVRTSEDFGSQGEAPSHPDLLDWLATEFIHRGWNVKATIRLMVTSATYRQSSRSTPQLRERDPENRFLARGPRFRLQAEFVRDQALAASGLLINQIGGPSVRPYHPPGLYEQIVAGKGANTYVVGKGSDLYRRSLYTYWKRSVPHPAMLAFDAPFRETCTLRRPRSNTPLQALNLLNDPTYVEAARSLAIRMLNESGEATASSSSVAEVPRSGTPPGSPEQLIVYGFRLVTGRPPRDQELRILSAAFDRTRRDFEADPRAAHELLKVGASGVDVAQPDPVSLAALTTLTSILLNLDETIVKE